VEVGGVTHKFVVRLERRPREQVHAALAARDTDVVHIGGGGDVDGAPVGTSIPRPSETKGRCRPARD
jgi:hypothetical protein